MSLSSIPADRFDGAGPAAKPGRTAENQKPHLCLLNAPVGMVAAVKVWGPRTGRT